MSTRNRIARRLSCRCSAKCWELCENGNEVVTYDMLWSGKAYNKEEGMARYAA